MESVRTSEGIHRRLRLLEIVVFISLTLNVVSGFLSIRNAHHVNQIEEQTGVRP